MEAVRAEANGVLDAMIERGEAAVDRYRARLRAMNSQTFSANRLRATIQVMQGRIDALRLSRDGKRTSIVIADTASPLSGPIAAMRH